MGVSAVSAIMAVSAVMAVIAAALVVIRVGRRRRERDKRCELAIDVGRGAGPDLFEHLAMAIGMEYRLTVAVGEADAVPLDAVRLGFPRGKEKIG